MELLVAVDGSEASMEALTRAIDVADAMDASITVAHAVDPSVFAEGGSEPIVGFADVGRRLYIENLEHAEERGERVLEAAEQFATDRDVSVETELLYGNPVEAITDFAETFDWIFVGHRGRTGRADLMLGSVAKSIVERATVPVTVIR